MFETQFHGCIQMNTVNFTLIYGDIIHAVFLFFYFNYLMTLYMYYKIIIYSTVKNHGQIEYVYNLRALLLGCG